MIVDGVTTEIHLDGEFSDAIQWQPFALDKLRQMIRSGYRGLRVMRMGEVQLRVWLDPASKQAKVWVAAAATTSGFIVNAMKLVPGVPNGIGATDTKLYGAPYVDQYGGEIEPPVGTISGEKPYWLVRPKFTVTSDGVETAFITKKSPSITAKAWGANDWVHKKDDKVVGFVTWGTVPGRSAPLSRREYDIQEVTSSGPTSVIAPYVFSGTAKKTAVYYKGKLLTDAAPGIVWGAAIFTAEDGKTYLRGISGKDTKGITFVSGGYVFRMARYAVAWEMELGGTPKKTPVEVATLELPEGVSYIFDTDVLFAFNQSGTKCSGVIRVGAGVEDGYDPWIDGGITSLVAHFTWEAPLTASGSTEGIPEITERVTSTVSTQNISGSKSVASTQGQSPQQTIAIDYIGDDEVRLEWRDSYNYDSESTEVFAITKEYESNGNTWADGYVASAGSEAAKSTSVVFSYRGADLLKVGGSFTLSGGGTASETGEFSSGGHVFESEETDTRVIYADLRYGVFLFSTVTVTVNENVQYTYARGGPGDVSRGVNFRLFLVSPDDNGALVQTDLTPASATVASHTYVDYPSRALTPDGEFLWGYDKKDYSNSVETTELSRACPTQQKCWASYHVRSGQTPTARVFQGYMLGASAATLPGKLDAEGNRVDPDVSLLSVKFRPLIARPYDPYSLWFGDPVIELTEQEYQFVSSQGDVRTDTKMDLLGESGFLRSIGLV